MALPVFRAVDHREIAVTGFIIEMQDWLDLPRP
jgi:hypothetical protein